MDSLICPLPDLGISVVIHEKNHLVKYRGNDMPITETFTVADFDSVELERLNQMQKHKKVLILSDVTRCDGILVDEFLINRTTGKSYTT